VGDLVSRLSDQRAARLQHIGHAKFRSFETFGSVFWPLRFDTAMPKTIYREEHRILADLLRELRNTAGLTQADLAPSLGRQQNRLSDIERGARRIDLVEFIDYCVALEKDPSNVFDELRRRLPVKGQIRNKLS
jgi:DNA-binding XRE family transcriptional regulator